MNSKASYTPGPWVVNKSDPDDQVWEIDAPAGDPLLGYGHWSGFIEVYGCDDEPEKGRLVAEANARLVAAAPDLLEALVEVMDGYLYGCDKKEKVKNIDRARTAIAKATGETAP